MVTTGLGFSSLLTLWKRMTGGTVLCEPCRIMYCVLHAFCSLEAAVSAFSKVSNKGGITSAVN